MRYLGRNSSTFGFLDGRTYEENSPAPNGCTGNECWQGSFEQALTEVTYSSPTTGRCVIIFIAVVLSPTPFSLATVIEVASILLNLQSALPISESPPNSPNQQNSHPPQQTCRTHQKRTNPRTPQNGTPNQIRNITSAFIGNAEGGADNANGAEDGEEDPSGLPGEAVADEDEDVGEEEGDVDD